jgi:hypothetical protein
MLSRILGWLGLISDRPSTKGPRPASRPRSATAHLFEKRAAPGQPSVKSNIEAENDFNPYNTGKFDRSASWDRISKNQR